MDGYKKKVRCRVARSHIPYDYQMTNGKQEGLLARTPTPLRRTPIGRLEVIYDSQRPEHTKVPPETGDTLTF